MLLRCGSPRSVNFARLQKALNPSCGVVLRGRHPLRRAPTKNLAVEDTDTPDPFDLGDTVRLTIGGPLMTILSVSGEHCCCMWFDERGKMQHGKFELEVIELVERAVRLV